MKPLPSAPRVLIVVAHPDDAVLAMGGTLLKLARRGIAITHLALSSGELGATRDKVQRAEELRRIFAACVSIPEAGAPPTLLFADLPDGAVPATGEPVASLLDLLQGNAGGTAFALAFLHGANDQHVDHVNAHRIGHRLARNVDSVLYFDSWSSLSFAPRLLVEVTDAWPQRMEMLRMLTAHPQADGMRRVELKAELCGTSLKNRPRPTYAEAFEVERLDASALCRCLGEAP